MTAIIYDRREDGIENRRINYLDLHWKKIIDKKQKLESSAYRLDRIIKSHGIHVSRYFLLQRKELNEVWKRLNNTSKNRIKIIFFISNHS